MEQQDLIYYVGLAVYTFDDLRVNGPAVVDLIDLAQRLFSAYRWDVAKVAFTAEQKRREVVEAGLVPPNELREALVAGLVARFQVQDAADSMTSQVQMWARLNATDSKAARPNHLLLRLPMAYFQENGHEAVQNLLNFGREAFERLNCAYGYGGIRVTGRSSDKINQVINASVDAIPVGDFDDMNIDRLFREQVKGAFWVNLLHARHVAALGGIEVVRNAAPCLHLEMLEGGGCLLLLMPSPLWDDHEEAKAAHARLRAYLQPITVTVKPTISPTLEKMGVVMRRSYNV